MGLFLNKQVARKRYAKQDISFGNGVAYIAITYPQ